MTGIQWNPSQLCIAYAGESLELLPKEYALLEFLYLHPGQVFSRDALLDAVWPLESPSDRTVDDHIYRLRKKLTPFRSLLVIDTVRGKGYVLHLKSNSVINPLSANPRFREEISHLFYTYLRYGQGEAIKMLATHRDLLGLELDHHLHDYLLFMNGEFKELVHNPAIPFWNKAFYLLHLYQFLDPHRALEFAQRALRSQQMPEAWQKELGTYNLVSWYWDVGLPIDAKQQLERSEQWILGDKVEALYPVLHNLKLLGLLFYDHPTYEQGLAAIAEVETLLQKYPYLREKGTFLMIKGMWLVQQAQPLEGVAAIDQGIELLQHSRFVPHLLTSLSRVVRQFERVGVHPLYAAKYKKLWEEQQTKYDLLHLREPILKQLSQQL
ncbi:winged helix-turn-helix domain-containing protein [Ammoniphilus sp. YIM 78166]|uniref:winged helix-turn-helix domain-containing protein n=1 Tax=Ammoniphilus sp. YIM 78166 TaxID=1644106 RepID=UPI001430386F|nr:winged helix-turn-helix domain-containing protein [Ammoniphilus sp. YIM 78166]